MNIQCFLNRTLALVLCTQAVLTACTPATGSEYRNVPEIKNIPDSSVPEKKEPVPVGIENLQDARSKTPSDVEVVWAIPDEAVEGYIITYGFEPNLLDRIVKLKSDALEKFEDKNYGFVYRYVLSGIPLGKTIYISISAFNGTMVSPQSKIIKVNAGPL